MKVTITCKEIVSYDQEVEMSEEDYNAIQAVESNWNDSKVVQDILQKYIDRWEVFDSDGFTSIDVYQEEE